MPAPGWPGHVRRLAASPAAPSRMPGDPAGPLAVRIVRTV